VSPQAVTLTPLLLTTVIILNPSHLTVGNLR